MKYINSFFLFHWIFLISLLFPTQVLQAASMDDQDSFESFFFDDISDDQIAGIDASAAHALTRTTKEDVLNLLTQFSVQNILQNPFYFRTNPTVQRNPFELPILQIIRLNHDEQTLLKIEPFYSALWKENYTVNSCQVDSYLNLNNKDAIEVIDENIITEYPTPEVIELFNPLRMQDHTFGLMFQGILVRDMWAFTFSTPILYEVDHFFLNSEERNRINNHPLFKEFSGDVVAFAKQHLVSDRIGIGDTQFSAEHLVHDDYQWTMAAGIVGVIPTGFCFKKGLAGTHFNPNTQFKFNLYNDLLNPFVDSLSNPDAEEFNIQTTLETLGTAILDRFSTILLERHIGNDYHVALGGFLRSSVNVTETISWYSRISLQLQTPSVLQRFFLEQAPPAAFDVFDWSNNTVQVPQKIDFLNEQFMATFFPKMFYATVFPGLIFQTTSLLKLHMPAGRWAPAIGNDLWVTTPEHILSINAPDKDLAAIHKSIARRGWATSGSLWFVVDRTPCLESSWTFGFKGYFTYLNVGYGEGFGLTFECDKNF